METKIVVNHGNDPSNNNNNNVDAIHETTFSVTKVVKENNTHYTPLGNKPIPSSSSSSHLTSASDASSTDHNHETENNTNKTNLKAISKWQIIEGLKDGQRFEEKPLKFSGYLYKRRKRPLKGWHKRYFNLENGVLSYAKSASDLSKGKLHGTVDVGLSVISTKNTSRRIDIDAEFILHLKVKKLENFNEWVNALRNHRLYRQHAINYGNNNQSTTNFTNDDSLTHSANRQQSLDCLVTKFNEIDISDELHCLQEKLIKLSSLLRFIEYKSASMSDVVTDLEGFKYKKLRRRFHLRKKKHTTSRLVVDGLVGSVTVGNGGGGGGGAGKEDLFSLKSNLSASHPSLREEESLLSSVATINQKDAFYENEEHKSFSKTKAMSEFVAVANEVNNDYRQLLKLFIAEKQRCCNLKTIASKCTSLNSVDEWSNKRSILANRRTTSLDSQDVQNYKLQQSMSCYSQDDSSLLSMSEYYDAEDKMTPSDYHSTTSEEEEDDDESVVTDFSEDGVNCQLIAKAPLSSTGSERRTKLPSVQPCSDISLWSLLCKNIGKDLSKISMPVTINEPLNVLQRLCEELEYCELLDMAVNVDDPTQRMLLIVCFAVSAYSSSSYRAGHKPFNPLLGETYECVREDKGFRFIAEQVSHHPPISACHCESKNYIFWQDLRVKSKFWGKSMEVIPFGNVNLLLKPFDCHYKWNKITTCVHNLFKGERYVDNYGELMITDSTGLTCKIIFEKASYWSNKKNQITGVIINSKNEQIEKIFGTWNESIHCGTPPSTRCIWRPGAMPENYQDYYGFSRFAIELNELTDAEKSVIPPTDTRFRPDQRLLEEGEILQAESVKLELEQLQRERRRKREEKGLTEYIPLWFKKVKENNEETYVFNGKYWEARENHFDGVEFLKLW